MAGVRDYQEGRKVDFALKSWTVPKSPKTRFPSHWKPVFNGMKIRFLLWFPSSLWEVAFMDKRKGLVDFHKPLILWYWSHEESSPVIPLIKRDVLSYRASILCLFEERELVIPQVLPIYPCCYIRIKKYCKYYEFYPTKRHKKPTDILKSSL